MCGVFLSFRAGRGFGLFAVTKDDYLAGLFKTWFCIATEPLAVQLTFLLVYPKP
jgi:hypothetical protein